MRAIILYVSISTLLLISFQHAKAIESTPRQRWQRLMASESKTEKVGTYATKKLDFNVAPKCPKSSALIHKCISTPKEGDHKLAASFLNAITICQKKGGSKFELVLSAPDMENSLPAPVSRVDRRVGATAYTVEHEDGNDWFSLVVGFGNPKYNKSATFSILSNEPPLSSTYTCE